MVNHAGRSNGQSGPAREFTIEAKRLNHPQYQTMRAKLLAVTLAITAAQAAEKTP